MGPKIRELGSFLIVRTAGNAVTWGLTQLKYRITQLGPELGPKVGTGPNSIKTVLTVAVRESHIANFGPNYAGTGPNFGPKCFVKDTQIRIPKWSHRVISGGQDGKTLSL